MQPLSAHTSCGPSSRTSLQPADGSPALPPHVPKALNPPSRQSEGDEIASPSPLSSHVTNPPILRQIIPSEDPQREVEVGDDISDPEVSGDGIGVEDDVELQGDEDEDEDYVPQDEDEGSGTASKPHRRRMLPPWLLDAFKARLAEAGPRDSQGLPSLYATQHTFWFPSPSTFFLLRQRNISPPQLFNPRFFLWDPQPLCPHGRIPCPNLCGSALIRHGAISHPRRCIDSNSTFWIIGYRYRCPSCIHPNSGKKTITFRSWDPRILSVLPSELSAEFPARLSHRSGISTSLFGWMRSCFQNGMGSKQFSDALRVQHLLRYDEIHLQYLDRLACLSLDGWMSRKYEPFLPFDNDTPSGFHGYVPAAQWVREMYDRYIGEHGQDFNQHMSLLSAEICALDHSHKVFNLADNAISFSNLFCR